MAAEDIDLAADPGEGEASTRVAAGDAVKDATRNREKAARAVEKAKAAIAALDDEETAREEEPDDAAVE